MRANPPPECCRSRRVSTDEANFTPIGGWNDQNHQESLRKPPKMCKIRNDTPQPPPAPPPRPWKSVYFILSGCAGHAIKIPCRSCRGPKTALIDVLESPRLTQVGIGGLQSGLLFCSFGKCASRLLSLLDCCSPLSSLPP